MVFGMWLVRGLLEDSELGYLVPECTFNHITPRVALVPETGLWFVFRALVGVLPSPVFSDGIYLS